MRQNNRVWRWTNVAVLLCGCGLIVAPARAQAPSDDWRYAAIVYLYLPEISGSATFPTGTTANITVKPRDLISNLNFAFMGSFEAQKGSWGIFTDIVYADASGSRSATRALSVSGLMIPASVTAYAHLDVRSTIWTLGGGYRVVAEPDVTVDLLLGTRGLFLDENLNWQFSGNVGPFVGPGRQGSRGTSPNNWDGIIGVKGRWTFGDKHAWFVPYYFDVGTGQSDLTWQGIAGVGYAFNWGEVLGVWRYLDYRFSSHSSTLTLSGPALGVTFRW